MIAISLGFCLIGGGLKGIVDNRFLTRRRPIKEHTPVYHRN